MHFVVVLSMLALQVVSVTFIKGGEAFNVIPESVTMGGTFRSMTNDGLSYLMKRIREVVNTDKSETHMNKYNGLTIPIIPLHNK